MDRNKKRSSRDDDSSKPEQNKKRQIFLPMRTLLSDEVLSSKSRTSVRPTRLLQPLRRSSKRQELGLRRGDVEEVLKLSYGYPSTAVKFFRWSGWQLNDKHSPYAWNLVVDLAALFSDICFCFSSYVVADRFEEAIMTFEVMDQYGVARDIIALNSLLSAIMQRGKTMKAKEFLDIAKDKIRPDADTYAILLEGWENENNVACARQTFRLLNRSVRSASTLWEAMVERNGCKPDTHMYNLMITLHCYLNNYDNAFRYLALQ
uniref:Uncharacterized protein n=1 Tax=Nelumbo nucifera TaxID=4432 RepID=A0A822YS65_NELNU|nr:TPA_asm: hypothetical protein HUJ06_010910 [Nelumbo nucifera]